MKLASTMMKPNSTVSPSILWRRPECPGRLWLKAAPPGTHSWHQPLMVLTATALKQRGPPNPNLGPTKPRPSCLGPQSQQPDPQTHTPARRCMAAVRNPDRERRCLKQHASSYPKNPNTSASKTSPKAEGQPKPPTRDQRRSAVLGARAKVRDSPSPAHTRTRATRLEPRNREAADA